MVYEYTFDDYKKVQKIKNTEAVKRDTCLHSAFVRIAQKNVLSVDNDILGYKTGDTVIISFETVLGILDDWAREKKDLKYYAIIHDDDSVHYHIVITFSKSSKCRFSTLKRRFPYGDIEPCRHGAKDCVQYLVHMNNPEKHQYDWEDIETNAQEKLEEYKIPGKVSDKVKLNTTISKILSGEYKEYDLYDSNKVDPLIFIKYRVKLENAVHIRNQQIINNPRRKISVIYLQGKTATGKTLWCQNYAEENHKSICISSSSNDPMQDYIGADIFVFDDYEFTMPIMDFSKSIDPHHSSSVKSRYRNKIFIGDTIFITSNKSILSLYPDALFEERAALFRKIQYVYQFEHTDSYGVSKVTICKIRATKDDDGKDTFVLTPIEEREWDFRKVFYDEELTEEGSIY